MSTFNGIVSEFPDIRIDFFRRNPAVPPPLACFLSHVHSDHLAGLESLRSPFVYCSFATREILLRLERYPCRINFAKGVLEARQQTYKHLAKVLKPLPLETPTKLELQPGLNIQVTLFDANHCPGSVMFLIEGNDMAILYTGDTRAEPWFVNKLSRSPNLVEYTSGIKTLDKIYLDTSFTESIPFETKAEGLAELLRKVAQYPQDTVFHLQAWTYGYEEVWLALSKALGSPIHVDDYKLRVYNSLKLRSSDNKFSTDMHLCPESPALIGYMCGNSPHPGCLTSNTNVRLHSCEKGNMCDVAKQSSVVRIQPIVAHVAGLGDLTEIGVGGGGDDLEREAEFDSLSRQDLDAILELILQSPEFAGAKQEDIKQRIHQTVESGRNIVLDLDIASFSDDLSIALENAVKAIVAKPLKAASHNERSLRLQNGALPLVIHFPYSRHSSYPELCDLVAAFRPNDVWPCTVNCKEWVKDGTSIASLFGEHCAGSSFAHDIITTALAEEQAAAPGESEGDSQLADTQDTGYSNLPIISSPIVPRARNAASPDLGEPARNPSHASPSRRQRLVSPLPVTQISKTSPTTAEPAQRITASSTAGSDDDDDDHSVQFPTERTVSSVLQKRTYDEVAASDDTPNYGSGDGGEEGEGAGADDSQRTDKSFTSTISSRHPRARQLAYYRTLRIAANDEEWDSLGLLSTDGHHGKMEDEL